MLRSHLVGFESMATCLQNCHHLAPDDALGLRQPWDDGYVRMTDDELNQWAASSFVIRHFHLCHQITVDRALGRLWH